jgi:co-chaperonin GroES (HSP10)
MSNVISDKAREKRDISPIPYLPGMNNVLIFRIQAEEKTAGGIVMPETARPVFSRGILLAMGLEAYDKLNDALIQVGDEVMLAHYAGRDREVADKQAGRPPTKVLELKAEDVLGSVEAVKRRADFELALDDEGKTMYQRKDK